MAESKLEKFKYGLLKLIDVSGFKVFDPVVRLVFGEEPRKQAGEVLKFLVTPVVFVLLCLGLWTVIAPRHKTKSGEVPTPVEVWDAGMIANTLNERENEKETDFALSGSQREAEITLVQQLLAEKKKQSEQLKAEAEKVAAAATEETAAAIAPVQKQYDELKAANKGAKTTRSGEIKKLAEAVAAGSATAEKLLQAIRDDNLASDEARDAEKELKDHMDEIRSNPPKAVKKTQLAYDAAANEVQHLSKRLDYLQKGNRSQKVSQAEQKTLAAMSKLESATTSSAILSAAKSVVQGEEKAARTAEQSYPRTATIWFQVRRSLFTVFVGFVMAAVIAIPVGIMCGLNKVVMACLTPIISIFKPVSPVVWLLIFQIVVGAFFPDPESHPLFVFFGSLPWIGELGVNPALVFSACTVAMCAVWPALVNTALGVSSIDKDHMNVARVLKLGLWSRLFKIIIPSSLPLVFAGLRISLGVGWMVLIAAEALSSSDGLGKYVWDEYQNGSSHSFANIIFACFVVGIIGFFLDRIMIVLQRSVSFDDGAAVV
ncbi:MAG: ABC transporter permease subunit [Planctomycetaceae bacterium]|nr:ABC transporter permease subunit [Planctomycetaceae bacterium]